MASIPGQVKALIFDVFGTLVDWRTSVAREAQRLLAPLGVRTDWLALADAWRAEYDPSMQAVRSGQLAFCKLDVLHRRNLETVIQRLGLDATPGLDEATRAELNLAWHRLDAWPDVSAGLTALRERFLLAPCSNGNIALMADLARHNGWHWDAILGAEVAGDYKPKPEVYLRSCEAFNLEPSQVMMVAAHSNDLAAAAACGLRTAFVARPEEFGGLKRETQALVPVDVSVESLVRLGEVARSDT
ncbi:MAG: haloacid dehalogenase type II [Betaproteobacteria bacterium]|nr:haloacid dehalogenase type II [Betaproteobacteria bacterium]